MVKDKAGAKVVIIEYRMFFGKEYLFVVYVTICRARQQ